MTPDTRTTENPEPRTEAGRRLDRHLRKAIGQPANHLVIAIEDEARADALVSVADVLRQNGWHRLVALLPEAAQGAAPRAEGLDVDRLRQAMADVIVPHHWSDYYPEGVAARYAALLALAPQERRDKEGTE